MDNFEKYRNITDEEKRLIQELQLDYMPSVVEEKLSEAYKSIPDPMPVKVTEKKSRAPVKVVFSTVGAVAACLVLLLTVNFVNPAFAESLPFIGKIFETVNATSIYYDYDTNVAKELEAKADTVTGKDAHLKNDQFEVYVRNVYYDGRFVHSALEMHSDIDVRSNDYHVNLDVNINGDRVLQNVNGDSVPLLGYVNWVRTNKTTYVADVKFPVPEDYRKDKLNIEYEFVIESLKEYYQKREKLEEDGQETISMEPEVVKVTGNSSLSFKAVKNDSDVIEIVETATSSGATVYSYTSSPAGVEIYANVPIDSSYGSFARLYTKEGKEIESFDIYNNSIFAGKIADPRDTLLRFAGLKEEIKEIVLQIRIREDEEDQSIYRVAEFTIDTEDKTIKATENYNDKNSQIYVSSKLERLIPTVHPTYRAADEELKEVKDYKLEYISSGGIHKSTYLTFVTPNEYRELRVELYVNDELRSSEYTKKEADDFYVAEENNFTPYTEYSYGDSFWETDGYNVIIQGSSDAVFIDTGFIPRDEKIKQGLNIQEINLGVVALQMHDIVTVNLYDADNNDIIYSETVEVMLPRELVMAEGENLYRQGSFSAYVIADSNEF